MTKLTKRFVDALVAPEKDRIEWDELTRGFGIRIKPSGVKSYVIQYRNTVGQSRRKTIGRHGVLTVDQARKIARDLLHDVASGNDPVAQGLAWKNAPTINDLMDEYLSNHVDVHNKQTTRAEVRRLVDRHIRPQLGTRRVGEIHRKDIAKLHQKMANTPRQANFVLSILSKAFNLSENWGYRPEQTNPVRLIVRYKEKRRERFVKSDELRSIGGALRHAESNKIVSPRMVGLFRLLAFTGCRLSEIRLLRWEEVDFQRQLLVLPDTKTGRRTHVLSGSALKLLAAIDRSSADEFVFPNAQNTGPFDKSNVERAWRRIRKLANVSDIRIHDLRHMVGTRAGASGANAFQIRDLLGHQTLAVTGRYVAQDFDPIRKLQNHISSEIEAQLSGEAQTVDP